MIEYIKNRLKKIFHNLKKAFSSKKKLNVLISNLNLPDRVFLCDLIYNNEGINLSSNQFQSVTTKYSEMVSTKSFRFIFYKQQYFMENSMVNYLDFSNGSRIRLTELDGIVFMINLKNIKSIKFAYLELDSLLNCFIELDINIKIVCFNGPINGYFDNSEFDKIFETKILNEKYNKNISSYIFNFSENLYEFYSFISEIFTKEDNMKTK